MAAPSLLDLYQRTSKHSNYQVLASALAPLLDHGAIQVKSRFEHERLAYILSHVPVDGLRVCDIGGNTGFFSFESLAHGARHVDYHEGNQAHCDFVRAAARQLCLGPRLKAHHQYVSFLASELAPVDCTLLLNVLHHLGDDFGDRDTAKEAAKQRMLDCLATLSRTTRTLVFQLGFNWKGDRHQPLFANGEKSEMIDFVERGTSADWQMSAIGIAERVQAGGETVFRDLSSRNVARDDALGEFLNRPIFIMQSRHAKDFRDETP